LEGQKRKKLEEFIPSHTGPKHHTWRCIWDRDKPLSIHNLVLRKSASHALTAGKTITSIHRGISNLIREGASLTNMWKLWSTVYWAAVTNWNHYTTMQKWPWIVTTNSANVKIFYKHSSAPHIHG
jgi:hypothetical protein